MEWRKYWKWFFATLGVAGSVLVAVIWIVDPYQNLPWSPPLERVPAASNQRYAYPAIARNPAFDSLVVGTSTLRLLRPDELNEAFGGRFANLSMNSGTAHEQRRIAELFARNHDRIRTLIVGIDDVWCEDNESWPKFTHRRFPEWMYDSNPWNDVLHLLEFKTFEVLGRQAGYLLGSREARYAPDGYRRFVPPQQEYDLERARQHIYRVKDKETAAAESLKPRPPPVFGSHVELRRLLRSFPDATRKVLVFVPYHVHRIAEPGSRDADLWDACREQVAALARTVSNTVVVDFMIPSEITKRDENYWDPLHYTEVTASRLPPLMASAADGIPSQNGTYRILVGPN